MKILVCAKQVPDTANVRFGKDYTLQREGAARVTNPADESALELGLCLRDAAGGRVTVLTMGPKPAESMLREALSRGADEAVLLCDPAFAGADTLATARTLAAAAQYLGGFDLILCGRRAADGETGQVGPMLAALMNLPCVTNALEAQVTAEPACSPVRNGGAPLPGNAGISAPTAPKNVLDACGTLESFPFSPVLLTVRQLTEAGAVTWLCHTPAVITLCEWRYTLRLPTLAGLRLASRAEIPCLTAAALGLAPAQCGLRGSPTRVIRVQTSASGLRTCEKLTVEAFLAKEVLP